MCIKTIALYCTVNNVIKKYLKRIIREILGLEHIVNYFRLNKYKNSINNIANCFYMNKTKIDKLET
jgi:hypothetical protein